MGDIFFLACFFSFLLYFAIKKIATLINSDIFKENEISLPISLRILIFYDKYPILLKLSKIGSMYLGPFY